MLIFCIIYGPMTQEQSLPFVMTGDFMLHANLGHHFCCTVFAL